MSDFTCRYCPRLFEFTMDRDHHERICHVYRQGLELGGVKRVRITAPETAPPDDMVNHPKHYTSHPSGVESIEITQHYNFCIGNTIKYLWRAGLKGDDIEDLKKARWYLDREIQNREASKKVS